MRSDGIATLDCAAGKGLPALPGAISWSRRARDCPPYLGCLPATKSPLLFPLFALSWHFMQFKEGQRWISESEPELGLGAIVQVGEGRVNVQFPATGVTRQYAIDNSPLKRVRF